MNPIFGPSLFMTAAAQASVPPSLALPLMWVTVLVWAMVALLLVSVVGILSAREHQPSESGNAVGAQRCAGRLRPCFACLR
ncbi:MAG: hypothetical protein ACHQ9S_10755 [Candidatus Binatia bacterium]